MGGWGWGWGGGCCWVAKPLNPVKPSKTPWLRHPERQYRDSIGAIGLRVQGLGFRTIWGFYRSNEKDKRNSLFRVKGYYPPNSGIWGRRKGAGVV